MHDFIVHSIPGSPCARAVMATLAEKGATWTLAPMRPGEHRQAPHLARHPFGRMPVLQHGDFLLYETQAILRYLDAILPDPPLTPADPKIAARMHQLMGINDWYLFPCARDIVFQRVVGPAILGIEPNEATIAGAMPRAHVVFTELSAMLGERPFLTGPALSLADLMLAPQLELFSRTPEWSDLTRTRTNLVRWLECMERRPALRQTLWEHLAALPQAS